MFNAFTQCFSSRKAHSVMTEKTALPNTLTPSSFEAYHDDPKLLSPDEVVDRILHTLLNSTLNSASKRDLQATLGNIVREAGWYEKHIAEPLFAALQHLVQNGKCVGGKLGAAYATAIAEAATMAEFAEEFAHEHPILTEVLCAVVALGILAVLWPVILDLLGFAEAGVWQDSFAALWQSTYRGYVPKGSLFSYLQRLGMTARY